MGPYPILSVPLSGLELRPQGVFILWMAWEKAGNRNDCAPARVRQ